MPKTYSKTTCRVCGEQTSTNGLARTSHAKKHVKEGLLVAVQPYNPLEGTFGKIDYVTPKRADQLTDPNRDSPLVYSRVAI